MSENSSVDALFTLGIPTNLAPAIQWTHTDFFYTLALTGMGYDSTVMPRCRSHLDFFRPDAMLTLIPIYQDFHFTLIVIDHIKRHIKGYDSLYGDPAGDKKMITNIRTIRRLLADEALAVNNHNYADDWVIDPDAAR